MHRVCSHRTDSRLYSDKHKYHGIVGGFGFANPSAHAKGNETNNTHNNVENKKIK